MSKKSLRVCLLFFFVGVTFFSMNQDVSGVMLPLSIEKLVNDSDVVLIGEAAGVKSYWNPGKTIIFTRANVFVYRVIIGKVEKSTIDVEYPGGKVGDIGMGASDQPVFLQGGRVLLFLESKSSFAAEYGKVYGVVGAAQGKYSIGEDGIARKGGFSVVRLSKDDTDSHPVKRKIRDPFNFMSVEEIIDADIPVDLLIKKIKGEKVVNLLPAENTSPTTLKISRPMYSSHGRWGNWPVPLKINTSGGPAYGLGGILAGKIEWNNVYTSAFEFIHSGDTSSKAVSRNGVNTIYFTNLSNYLGFSNWWYSGGYIVETDIRLDSSPVSYYPWNFNRLRAVVMHELGHSLGLNHVSIDAVMKIPIIDSRLRLFPDDVNAVTDLYPAANAQADFSNDGSADILFRNRTSGEIVIYLMNGTTISSAGSVATLNLKWLIKKLGDFNGDGKADILLWDSNSGEIVIFLMDGTSIIGSASIGTLSYKWKIRGIGDFNNDSKDDILFWDSNSGEMVIYVMNGTTVTSAESIATLNLKWKIRGLNDFNGDGKMDILLQDSKDGEIVIYLMNGTTISSSGSVGILNLKWQINKLGDFNGDGKTDILLRDCNSGEIVIFLMDGTSTLSVASLATLGLKWHIKAIGDFNNDSKDDILFWDRNSGEIVIYLMNGTAIANAASIATLNLKWKIKGLGDFNGDGKTDLLLWDSNSGEIVMFIMDGTTISSTGTVAALNLNWRIQ